VGVTGALGSGKTVFCRALAELPGVRLLDADRVGHEALRPGAPLVPKLVDQFGEGILDERGGVNRSRLARKVFSGRGRVRDLNAIVHPWLVSTLRRRILRLNRREGVDIVVLDVALLFEWDLGPFLDRVVVVEAPAAKRRLWLEQRGLSKEQIRGREAAQWSPRRKRALADIIVRNEGSIESLRARAHLLGRNWLRRLKPRHGRGS
jgi:dephospho-CoA kinase